MPETPREEAERLLAAIAPSEWRAEDVPSQGWTIVWGPKDGTLRPICHMRWTDGLRPDVEARIKAEAEFIAAAPRLLSAFLRSSVERQTQETRPADYIVVRGRNYVAVDALPDPPVSAARQQETEK